MNSKRSHQNFHVRDIWEWWNRAWTGHTKATFSHVIYGCGCFVSLLCFQTMESENSRNLLLSTFLVLLKAWQFEMLDPRPSAISQCLKIKYLTDFVLFVCFCCVLFRCILFRNDLSVAMADLELVKPWAFCLLVSASWALVLQIGTTSPGLKFIFKFIKFLCH